MRTKKNCNAEDAENAEEEKDTSYRLKRKDYPLKAKKRGLEDEEGLHRRGRRERRGGEGHRLLQATGLREKTTRYRLKNEG